MSRQIFCITCKTCVSGHHDVPATEAMRENIHENGDYLRGRANLEVRRALTEALSAMAVVTYHLKAALRSTE